MNPGADTPGREQLIYWLFEAAEIEHHLMCCYLYAGLSLKEDDPVWTPLQREAVTRWRGSITTVAMEEMTHLALVGNLLSALGAAAHFNRPAFPVGAGPYPSGFVIRLAPFSLETVAHFKYLERPTDAAWPENPEYAHPDSYTRRTPSGRLSPGARDYATVGELYQAITSGITSAANAHGDRGLFIGDPLLQVDVALAPLPGLTPVTDLQSAMLALHTIVVQGEGAGDDQVDSHFMRFSRMHEELAELTREDPAFAPAWPAALNPVMNAPIASVDQRVFIDSAPAARMLDVGNALYTASLRCLQQGFSGTERSAKRQWLDTSFSLMRAMGSVGRALARVPARDQSPVPHAGLTFTPLRALTGLPQGTAVPVVMERLKQIRGRVEDLQRSSTDEASAEIWQILAATLERQHANLLEMQPDGEAIDSLRTRADTPAVKTPQEEASGAVEIVVGNQLTILFESQRCIHSRHCVLEAPEVFRANTPGDWIFPDAMGAEALVSVARNCPSGAIRYRRNDGGAEEEAPLVNTLRTRENGPYAVHADIKIAGRAAMFRATLCRCGQSRNKPWCDGAHVASGFMASGEPVSGTSNALPHRGGRLEVIPLRNGPLQVEGNLEVCSGTGRTVARETSMRLCRCGHSKNKPFCDMSHHSINFMADGD